jgi:hypothetical protein
VLLPRLPESSPLHQVWAALPRRLGGLGHEDLQELAWRCQAILEEAELALQDTPMPTEASAALPDPVRYSGEAEKNFRPTTYTSEPTPPPPVGTGLAGYARRGERSGLAGTSPLKLCGVEHVTLAMALHAAPEEWHGAFTRMGSLSWDTFSRMAQARLQPLGINQQAWRIAETAIGSRGAAILVLIADANWAARGGQIRKPGAWVRAMAERAAGGQAYLHRSVFGILKRPAGGAQ